MPKTREQDLNTLDALKMAKILRSIARLLANTKKKQREPTTGRRRPRTPGNDSPPPQPSSSRINTTEATTRADKDMADISNMVKTLKCTTNQDSSNNQQMCQGTTDTRADPDNRNPNEPK